MLHKLYWVAVRQNANLERWLAKQPQNRRRPEPPTPIYNHLNSKILIAFQEAKTPVASPDQVPPARMTESEIDELLGCEEKIAV